ncbi:hypothetical protein RhiirC2_788298, partial [Rhizophagus irregularis]
MGYGILPSHLIWVSKVHGITQDPQTKNYMMVLNDKCKLCNLVCSSIHFQQKFGSWTSGNDEIDNIIQDTQLSSHYSNIIEVLEWVPHDRFRNIKYIEEKKVFSANWIDGYINKLDNENQDCERSGKNMSVDLVDLKSSNNPKNIESELTNKRSGKNMSVDLVDLKSSNNLIVIRIELLAYEVNSIYGITQDPQTKNYMIVLIDKCKKCNLVCSSIHFQQNFKSWTSGNDIIDKFIQDTQLSAHNNVGKALEWIPNDGFHDIKHIEEKKMCRA